jgi:hypothetical protein
MIGRPAESEYAPFYAGYVSRVPETDILEVLTRQPEEWRALTSRVAAARETFAYAPGKWTIRQLVGHMTDAERVFGFRAFCFSRGDRNPLPGFDENDYVAGSRSAEVPLAELVADLAAIREVNLSVLRRLDEAAWARVGTASNASISVRALAYIMAGHVRHHLNVLATRYLDDTKR